MTTVIGYARVSTRDQDAAMQVAALEAAGASRVFRDTASGARSDRTGLADALDYLRPGDVLMVWKLDRLSRSLQDLLRTMALLEDRGVGFRSLTEPGLDTTTPGGRLIFTVFGAVNAFERELIIERTNAGLAAARARGKRPGRPPSLTAEQVDTARELRADGKSLAHIAGVLRTSKSTIKRVTAA